MPLRILIVDDDKHTCRILKTLLERDPPLRGRGVQVSVASDGEKGLLALDEGPVDLVLSDLLMPRMDGFAFCRELRRRPGCHKVPLIVSSAVYKDPITVRKLHVEVGAEFFTKPFQVAEMLAAVRRLLGVGTGGGTGPSPRAASPGDRGSLGDLPPPRLLLDLYEARSSCCLLLQRGELRRRVHLLMGHVIAVESNTRADALGALLHARGLLSEEQLREILIATRDGRRRLGQVLLERGFIDEVQLLREMEAQMQRRVAQVLRWGGGEFQVLPPGPAYERITLHGGTPTLVFSALRDTARPSALARTWGRLTAPLHATPRAARMREPFERVFGPGALSLLAEHPSLSGLTGRLPDGARDALLICVDAMLLCGLCAPGPSAADDGPGPRRSSAPQPIGPGAIELQVNSPPVLEVTPAMLDPRHRRLLGEYLAVDGRDHYELLGVARTADLTEIQAAYQAIIERLSPERFSDLDLGRDYGKISELRERYRLALGVLSSPLRRAAYDRELGQERTEEMGPQAVDAELLHRQGAALLEQGLLSEALPLLQEAAAGAPEQADYHALLGWAHFLVERHAGAGPEDAARRAQQHLQRALAIDEDHLGAHGYAGHIALALALDEQAAQHFERVLDHQPDRKDALVGLERARTRLAALG